MENVIPLNCVDRGFLALHEIGERLCYHWELSISGEVSFDSLNRAIVSALRLYPCLRSTAHGLNSKAYRKIHSPDAMSVLTFKDLSGKSADNMDLHYENAVLDWINRPLDPTTELPFRALLLKRSEARFALILTFDHHCADGYRSLNFVQEVLRAYNNRSTEHPPLEPITPEPAGDALLRCAREQGAVVKNFYLKMLSALIYRFLIAPFRPPVRLFHRRSPHPYGVGYCFVATTEKEFKLIREKAKKASVTVNDILAAACYRAIERWNSLHGRKSNKISIMVPVAIGPRDGCNGTSNRISYISPYTMHRDRANPEILLQKVSCRIKSLLASANHFSMIYFLHVVSVLPHPVIRALARFVMCTRVYVDTTVLTNLGEVWSEEDAERRLGNAFVEDVHLIMPVVRPMSLMLGTLTYNNILNLCAGYSDAVFTGEDAKQFLELYLAEIRGYIGAREQRGASSTGA
jgi:NRPS condensation-like uncharacterized protein